MQSCKKGQRVKVMVSEGKGHSMLYHGVISKGGSRRCTAVLDGGYRQVSGHPSVFEESDVPLPKDPPSVMDKWGVVGHKEFRSLDGGGFNAFITLNGKKVMEAMNEGHGGPNNYWPCKGQKHDVVDQLQADAKEWAKQFESDYTIEVEDLWVDWCVSQRPYGVLASQYLKRSE